MNKTLRKIYWQTTKVLTRFTLKMWLRQAEIQSKTIMKRGK